MRSRLFGIFTASLLVLLGPACSLGRAELFPERGEWAIGIACNTLGQMQYVLQKWSALLTEESRAELGVLFDSMSDEGSRPRCGVAVVRIVSEVELLRVRRHGEVLVVSIIWASNGHLTWHKNPINLIIPEPMFFLHVVPMIPI